MGCCNSSGRNTSTQIIICKTLRAIEHKDLKILDLLIMSAQEKINDQITEIRGIKLNCLGYALWIGQAESFIHLHTAYKASITAMEALLNYSDTSSLHILCEKNEKRYLDILRYYLPFYLQEITEYPQIEEIGTSIIKSNLSIIDAKFSKDSQISNLPIQIACLAENVTLLDFVHKFFATQPYTPRYLDMEYQNETTGDNCVLLACRYAKYKLIVFFHKACKLNFRVKNNFGHNAINVLLAGASKMYSKSHFNCLRYLIEVVGLDCEWNYQYSLSVSEQPEIIEYLEMKLREIGVYETKKEVDIRTRGVLCDKKMSTNETYDTIPIRDALSQLKFRSVSSSVFQD